MRVALLTVLLLLNVSSFAAPAPGPAPATRPDAPPPAGAGAAMMLERARQAVDQLKLTPDQKGKVETIFKEARAELEQMKTQLESMEMRDRMAEAREFMEGVRADLAFVLTPEQRQQMQQKFEQMRDAPPGASAGPGAGAGPGAMPPPGAIAERLRDIIPKLKLSDDQAVKIKTLFDDLRPRADALRQQIEMGDDAARAKARELSQETRQKLDEILTAEQRDRLRDLLRQPPANSPPRARDARNRPSGGPAATRAARRPGEGDQMSDMTMTGGDTMMSGGDMMDGAAARKKGAAAGAAGAGAASDAPKVSAGPAIGDRAPDFTLTKPDGAQVSLASLKGRIVVLVFGSYSAPTFRNRVPAMEKLRSDFGTRATFFVVYTREAHPTGEWEVARNKEDGISVEQARTLDARKSAATTAREKLKMVTPILLDTMGNDTMIAYGSGINSAYVIGRDGTIVARQQWFEPIALRRALETAIAAKPATRPAP